MKYVIAGVIALMLAACEGPAPAAKPAPQPTAAKSGVSVSGYARVGVSRSF